MIDPEEADSCEDRPFEAPAVGDEEEGGGEEVGEDWSGDGDEAVSSTSPEDDSESVVISSGRSSSGATL